MNTWKSKFVRYAGLLALGVMGASGLSAPAHAAGMLVADGGLGGRLEIKEHDVKVTINNGIAVTRVTQIFQNKENRQVEALYTFPVPAKASVANFSMWINGKEMIGEVVEKKRARQIYNSYKQRRRDPGLLEQVDFKTFEMRVFPIAPLAEQKVEIAYYQELTFDHDWATYVYPLATTSERSPDSRVDGKFAFTLEVKSQVPIVSMESPSHRDAFAIASHSEAYYEASLENSEGSLSRDIVVAYRVSRPHTGIDLITSKTGREDGYFYLTMTPGEELSGDTAGMDYVFILDISGSMGTEGKLQLSSDSIAAFVNSLGEADRFEVMTFNNQPITHFNELRPVTSRDKADAVQFINAQRARGATVLQSAMRAAYNYADVEGDRTLNLVILSDGMTQTTDQAALLDVSGARPKNVRVFCVGVGNDVNKPLLSQLAERAGGLAAFISHGDDFARQAEAFRRKLTRPIATGLSIEISGLEVYDVVPEKLPNLYHGVPVRMYGRYKNSGQGTVTVRADVQGFDLKQNVEFTFPKTDTANPEIERMWALQKVNGLNRELRLAGDAWSKEPAIREIVRLGEAYSIVTEYTSFLVLENDGEYKRWKIERRNALRVARDRQAQDELRTELNAIRSRAAADLGPIARQQLAKAMPEAARPTSNGAPTPRSQALTPPRQQRGQDVDFQPRSSSSSGGGAIDPISGSIVVGLGLLVAAHRRRSR